MIGVSYRVRAARVSVRELELGQSACLHCHNDPSLGNEERPLRVRVHLVHHVALLVGLKREEATEVVLACDDSLTLRVAVSV